MLNSGPTGLANNAITEIKDRIGIVDVVSARVTLKKSGRSLKGVCPFHNEKTPSFFVFPDKGNYHCFGCGANGDIFTFVQKTENLDFPEVLALLAERAGIKLQPRKAQAQEDERFARFYQMNALAAQYYHGLLRRDVGREALAYLVRRGITEQTAEAYQIGWAPGSHDALINYMVSRDYETRELVEVGLAAERDQGLRDLLWSRVTFPIRDERGNITGFGARTLGDNQPKYLNTPTTPIFDKGGSLYGIEVAKPAIRETGIAVIVEGYMDVLIAHQSGIKNVTAALGTALTERQLGLLKRLTKSIVLALDPDAAGQSAALRGIEVARQVYGGVVPVPQPTGVVQLEQRLDADIRIASMPDGLDPDEVVRRDPAEWHRLIAAAKPTVEFAIDAVLAKADLASAKGTSEAVQKLLPTIAELRDDVQKAYYLRTLGQRTGIALEILQSELRRLHLRKSDQRAVGPRKRREIVKSRTRPNEVLDEYYIELMLEVLRSSSKFGEDLDESDMRTPEGREVLGWLRRRYEDRALKHEALAVAAAEDLPEPLAAWISRLLTAPHTGGKLLEPEIRVELNRTVTEVRRRNLRLRADDLAEMMRQAAEEIRVPGTSESIAEREYIKAAEAILTQLQPYELSSHRTAIWRRSSDSDGRPERKVEEPGNA